MPYLRSRNTRYPNEQSTGRYRSSSYATIRDRSLLRATYKHPECPFQARDSILPIRENVWYFNGLISLPEGFELIFDI